MSALDVFQYAGHEVRTVTIDGEPWFVLADLTRVLGLSQFRTDRLDDGLIQNHPIQDRMGRGQQALIVSESGMYEVVIRSDKAEAAEFRRWITGTVLPTIRKTGSYGTPALPDISTPEGVLALAQTLTKTAEELVAAKNAVAELEPLASQARTFNKVKGNTGRQQFARAIVNWALGYGYTIKFEQVYEFMGRKLDLFIHGVGRSDHGHASTAGLMRGYSATERDESRINGHKYAQGVLTPSGYEYAWSRIEKYVRENGHLELPKKGKSV